ncbi:unnamed protein product, partial [Callosobruchus maculatus]
RLYSLLNTQDEQSPLAPASNNLTSLVIYTLLESLNNLGAFHWFIRVTGVTFHNRFF